MVEDWLDTLRFKSCISFRVSRRRLRQSCSLMMPLCLQGEFCQIGPITIHNLPSWFWDQHHHSKCLRSAYSLFVQTLHHANGRPAFLVWFSVSCDHVSHSKKCSILPSFKLGYIYEMSTHMRTCQRSVSLSQAYYPWPAPNSKQGYVSFFWWNHSQL